MMFSRVDNKLHSRYILSDQIVNQKKHCNELLIQITFAVCTIHHLYCVRSLRDTFPPFDYDANLGRGNYSSITLMIKPSCNLVYVLFMLFDLSKPTCICYNS